MSYKGVYGCCCGSFDCAEQSGAITESWPGGGPIEDWTLFFAERNPQAGNSSFVAVQATQQNTTEDPLVSFLVNGNDIDIEHGSPGTEFQNLSSASLPFALPRRNADGSIPDTRVRVSYDSAENVRNGIPSIVPGTFSFGGVTAINFIGGRPPSVTAPLIMEVELTNFSNIQNNADNEWTASVDASYSSNVSGLNLPNNLNVSRCNNFFGLSMAGGLPDVTSVRNFQINIEEI